MLDVNAIATDADLARELGGAERLTSTQKDVAVRDAYRASALQDVLASLAVRSPPILAGDVSIAAELKLAVVYRALSKICYGACTGASEDRNLVLAKKYATDYQEAVRGRFTMSSGAAAGPSGWSFSYERR